MEKMSSLNTESELILYIDFDQIKHENKFLQILPADLNVDSNMKFVLLDPLYSTNGLVHLTAGQDQANLAIHNSADGQLPSQMKFAVFIYDEVNSETKITLDLKVRSI